VTGTASCIYEGSIRHRRRDPPREFRHRLALAYLDLEELPTLLGGRLVSERPGLLRFRRADYLGDPRLPLDQAVRDEAEERTGRRPAGPIRMLAQPRWLGHCFNPVSFYYCLTGDGRRIEALVAEVTNTPWGERHAYVIAPPEGAGARVEASFAKALHVSPFMGMDHTYRCLATAPADTLSVHMENHRGEVPVFDATLSLRRRELGPASARRLAARYPLGSWRVLALIYLHALRLRLAGAPRFPHPAGGGV
jgi:DUF1365 family protein